MMKNLILLLSVACVYLFGCNTKNEQLVTDGEEEAVETAEIVSSTAVCIWDQISVRQEPNDKSKWLTSVSLGEKVTFLNESVLDSAAKRQYVKIRLSDDTEGWSLADFIVNNGKPAVFLGDAEYYKRPDLMTKSGISFKTMDIVAISNEQDGWYEVKGKRADGKFVTTGWIKPENLSLKDIDIAVAKYTSAAMAKTGEEKLGLLKQVLENSTFSESYFIPLVKKEVMDLEQPVLYDEEDEYSPELEQDESEEDDSAAVNETLI